MVKDIFSFKILADTRYKKPSYRIFWVGTADYHIMNWRGCNFHMIEDEDKKVFHNIKEAVEYAKKKYQYKMRMSGVGQHLADSDNYIEARTVYEDGDELPNELSEEEWDELRTEVSVARLNREVYSF